MTIAVMHLNNTATLDMRAQAMMGFNTEEHATTVAKFLAAGGLYDIVAVLPGIIDLDYAYENTNSIDVSWTAAGLAAHKGVIPATSGPVRSTSVGDVMVVSTSAGVAVYVVSNVGFTDITDQWKGFMAALGKPVRQAL